MSLPGEIDVEARVARAHELHEHGHNCAQSVACACADLVGLDPLAAFRMTEGFGYGMGGMTETCGAVVAGVAVLAYSKSEGPANPKTKAVSGKLARELTARFREQNGSTICGELKGVGGAPMLRSCHDCVEDAMRLTLELLSR